MPVIKQINKLSMISITLHYHITTREPNNIQYMNIYILYSVILHISQLQGVWYFFFKSIINKKKWLIFYLLNVEISSGSTRVPGTWDIQQKYIPYPSGPKMTSDSEDKIQLIEDLLVFSAMHLFYFFYWIHLILWCIICDDLYMILEQG